MPLQKGEVVWGRSFGFPAWPGVVLEAEEWESLPEAGPGQVVLYWLKWAKAGGDVFGVVEEAECEGLLEGWLKLAPLMAGRRRSRGGKPTKPPKPTLKVLNCLRACAKIINHIHKKTILDEKAESLDSWERELQLNGSLLVNKKPILDDEDWAIYVDDSIPVETEDGELVGYVGDKKASAKPRGRPAKNPKLSPSPTPPKPAPATKVNSKAAGNGKARKRREAQPSPPDTDSPPPFTKRPRNDDKPRSSSSNPLPPIKAPTSPSPPPAKPPSSSPPKTSDMGKLKVERGVEAKRRVEEARKKIAESQAAATARLRPDHPSSFEDALGRSAGERTPAALRQKRLSKLLGTPSPVRKAKDPPQPPHQRPAALIEADWPDLPNWPTHNSPPLPPDEKPAPSEEKPLQPALPAQSGLEAKQDVKTEPGMKEGDGNLEEEGENWASAEEDENWAEAEEVTAAALPSPPSPASSAQAPYCPESAALAEIQKMAAEEGVEEEDEDNEVESGWAAANASSHHDHWAQTNAHSDTSTNALPNNNKALSATGCGSNKLPSPLPHH